ncbi:hypothetical protein Tco_1551244 [Tanacetum coccineum]
MSFIGVLRSDLDEFPDEMYMEKDEVVFKNYSKGHFKYDPLRYVNGSVSCVSAFTHDKDVFPRCLNHIMSKIDEHKWELFYRIPEKSLEKGLKLLHTDNDVHPSLMMLSTPFDTRYKRKISKSKETGVIHDEGAGRNKKKILVNGGNKRKEKLFKDEGADKKQKKTLVTGAMVNGKDKMVEVEGAVKTGRDRGVKEGRSGGV